MEQKINVNPFTVRYTINAFIVYCREKGWTSRKAAQQVGCSQPHLANVLNSRRGARFEIIKKIAEIMLSDSYEKEIKKNSAIKKLQ